MQEDFFDDLDERLILSRKLRLKFSNEIYASTTEEIAATLRKAAERYIQKYRTRYNDLATFKEKNTYFNEKLVHIEAAYKKYCLMLLEKPKPYEAWLSPRIFNQMKKHGYRATLSYFMSMGLIYEN